ncbi:TolC family protein [Sulfurospirillum sp. 1612]|uniref:TolC family protein n=1 Tax=Sulfurospirillum sp. 1612 TaxID=3094835 RepID=UPI002F94700D
MKRFFLLLFVVAVIDLQAVTMSDLFHAIKQQPSSQLDSIRTKMAQIGKDQVRANYFPVVNGFAAYTHYNSPTNMKPLDPLNAAKLMGDNKSIPFAKTIQKFGVHLSVPLFVKELSDLSHKAAYLLKSAKLRKKLNFYQNEALVLGANANLQYLQNLTQALEATKRSLMSTKKTLEVSVNSGRTPAIALDKLDEKLNQLDIALNNVAIKSLQIRGSIENLTGITLKDAVPMESIATVQKHELYALKPLQEAIHASQSDLKAAQAKRYYPKVTLSGLWSENYAPHDVFKNDSVHTGYGYYELGVSLPLYNKNGDVAVEMKQVAILKEKMQLAKTKNALQIEAKELENNLVLLKRSQKLNRLNIQKRKALLQYAKVAYQEGRMIEEDYLNYEDKLLSAKASYFETISQEWQSRAKLAVLYGNDLKGIVR